MPGRKRIGVDRKGAARGQPQARRRIEAGDAARGVQGRERSRPGGPDIGRGGKVFEDEAQHVDHFLDAHSVFVQNAEQAFPVAGTPGIELEGILLAAPEPGPGAGDDHPSSP